MAAATTRKDTFIEETKEKHCQGQTTESGTSDCTDTSVGLDEIERKVLWLKTKLKEGPVDGPSSLKTYREDIRQILFKEFNSPISDLEIGVVVRKAFPRHTRKGKYYLGIGTYNDNYADKTIRSITTDNPKSLMTIQSDGESRESSPVMLKPVKKRAIQAWRETENGQAFAADQMIRDTNNHASAPVVSVVPSDNLIRPPWQPMLMLPHHLHMPHRAMMFPTGRLPATIPLPHPVMVTTEPNNNIHRTMSPSRPRKRTNTDVDPFQKMSFGSERTSGKKSRKEGAMIELSSSRNGIIAERTNLAAMHIQPIILNFEVPPVKLPLSTSAGNSSFGKMDNKLFTNSKSEQSSIPLSSRLEKLPLSPRPGECSASNQGDASKSSLIFASGDSGDSSCQRNAGESSTQSSDRKSSHPFKKPDIDNYRNNVSAGRCFLCQNPIPPNQNKDSSPEESAIFTICMMCKKVAMSSSKSLKPVPKFPFACNPKLAPKTVYVPPPRRPFRPKAPSPSGPPKAVGIRLYPPQVRCRLNSPRASAAAQSSGPPRSPGQMSVPGSPAPSLPLGSPQPMSPALVMHSAPSSPRHGSDATACKMKSVSLPPSPSMITQHHPPSPVGVESKEPDAPKRPHPSMSLQVPSPYSPNPASPGSQEHSSSERLSLPPGREQDDTTVKALLQLGRPVERSPSEHGADTTPVPSPTSRMPDRDTVVPQLYPGNSIPVPHLPISLSQAAMPSRLPMLPGHIPLIPPNAGLVMGPGGQLLPLLPSWPRMSIPTNESQNIMPQGVYPQIPLLMQQPITRESSPTVTVPTLDSIVSGIKSRSLDPVKTNSGSSPESLPYDISHLKYRKGIKRSRISDRTDSPAEQSTFKGDPVHDDKAKSKQSIVIVGTNCAGSSSVKLNSDAKKASYQEEGVSREAPEMYGKQFGSFHCRCSGRDIVMLQCTDCDFVCNNKFGLELHIAAQRHAESRTRSSVPEVLTRHVNEADDRDETASVSSVETQSADTDTDAASPLPTMVPREVPWSRGPDNSRQSFVQTWQESISHYTPEHSISSETIPRTSRASFISPSTYGSFGTVTENILPLDLSGRTFHPVPYLPDLSGLPFHLRDKRTDSREASSPLDLSGHSRSPSMSATGDAGMQHFLSSRKPGTQGSMTAKNTPLDLFSSQSPLSTPNLVLTTTSNSSRKPPVLRTFYDLMRLHNMPVPSTAVTSTTNTSKGLHSQLYSKPPSAWTSTGPSSPCVSRTRLDSPSNDNSTITSAIPNIVLSSSFATASNVSRNSANHTTELSRVPASLITSPILTPPQSLNYQGGIISIRPTIPVPQMHVSSKTVPVLSPFPLSSPVSASENAASPGQEHLHLDSLNVNIGSPNFYLHSPSTGSPTVQECPKARQRSDALEYRREHSVRKDTSPVRSNQRVHIKIEPPDSLQISEYGREGQHLDEQEQCLQKEAEEQARILEASLARESSNFTGRSGIGRAMWGISSRSLQIRDGLYTYTTADSSRSQPASPSEPPLRTCTNHDSSSNPAFSPGTPNSNVSRRECSRENICSPFADSCSESSREACGNPEDKTSSGQQCTSGNGSTDSNNMENGPTTRHSNDEPDTSSALQIKVEK